MVAKIASDYRKPDGLTLVTPEEAEAFLAPMAVRKIPGIGPKTEQTLVPSKFLRSDLVVFDAVYNPRRTRLLREAALNGCRVVEGMEMFLGQAMVQFELWTGKPAPMEAMRRVVEARL